MPMMPDGRVNDAADETPIGDPPDDDWGDDEDDEEDDEENEEEDDETLGLAM